jgi:hypothetical protein
MGQKKLTRNETGVITRRINDLNTALLLGNPELIVDCKAALIGRIKLLEMCYGDNVSSALRVEIETGKDCLRQVERIYSGQYSR